MSIPVLESFSTFSNQTAVAANSVDKPSGTVEGDLIVFCYTLQGTAGVTPPEGAVQVITETSDIQSYIFYLKAGASEPASYEFTDANHRVLIFALRISGVELRDPINASVSGGPGITSTANVQLPSITTTIDDCLVIDHVARRYGEAVTYSPNNGGVTKITQLNEASLSGAVGWLDLPLATTTSGNEDWVISPVETFYQ